MGCLLWGTKENPSCRVLLVCGQLLQHAYARLVQAILCWLLNTTGINQITNLTDLNQENEWMDLDPTTIIVISVFLIVVGAIILLFGYRLLSFSAFICGGLIAAVILFGILASAISNDDPAKREIVYYSCLGAWLVFGIVAACCLQFAIFVLGAALGVFVAVLLNPVALQYVWIQHAFSDIYIWIAVFALIGGILACFLQRPLIIISTALGGALFIAIGICNLIGGISIIIPDGVSPTSTTEQSWIFFAGTLGLAVCCFSFNVWPCDVGKPD